MSIKFRTRKLIKPEDLNGRNTLFGGGLLAWIDEECAIYCACQMKTRPRGRLFIKSACLWVSFF